MGVGRRVLLLVVDSLLAKICSVNPITQARGFLYSILVVLDIVFVARSIQHTVIDTKRDAFLREAIIDRFGNPCCVAHGNDDDDDERILIIGCKLQPEYCVVVKEGKLAMEDDINEWR